MNELSKTSEALSELESHLLDKMNHWNTELQALLPNLPSAIEIEFDNDYLVPGTPSGGATWNSTKLKIAYSPGFDINDPGNVADLKATYSHECYHLARDYSFETTPDDQPAIAMAIEEGLATKFEMAYASSNPGYAQYEDDETMLIWLKEVKGLPNGFDYDWQKYKFFDKETNRRWIIYKVGVFVVNKAIKNSDNHNIHDLDKLTVQEILELAKL